ncbi:MAG: hypothetical protein Q7N95_14195 [Alphaproteobacteria bacterium]|nr:hypothetical protein [Alphaproteobacteria bacterium]
MTYSRNIALALAISSAGLLAACNTAPVMPMGSASAAGMGTAQHMAKMDMQMKTMHEMHIKMTNAKTPAERQALMADHMKAMQGGMGVMKDMPGMGGMSGMGGPKGMSPEMAERHKMMMQHMTMMKMMMDMMAQRMPS